MNYFSQIMKAIEFASLVPFLLICRCAWAPVAPCAAYDGVLQAASCHHPGSVFIVRPSNEGRNLGCTFPGGGATGLLLDFRGYTCIFLPATMPLLQLSEVTIRFLWLVFGGGLDMGFPAQPQPQRSMYLHR
ncbi:hypothetical protein GALMADRAFT_273905 [Galerina marginata CBS 339.88]|uniref:Secreted protein n=1 Tax=Galerina marginata (strain CBS 339.88) TaxID=685588 RepID=A0A067SFI6_GALM3|nr:hypothetical protein GALMADRAFT_273905 [Galerina marginata CBS 339.88]